jgi:hypothetical protein
MYRNDRVFPSFALLLSIVLFAVAYFDGRHIAALKGHPIEKLSSGMVGLVAFGFVLLVFGVIGLLVVWLEGEEPRPIVRRAAPGPWAFAAVILAALALVASSGIFVQAILWSQSTRQNLPLQEGVLFGIVALLVATVLALYKRYFQDEEVKTESMDSEVPW